MVILCFFFRCASLASEYHESVYVVQGIITFFVVINFALATFTNPGKSYCFKPLKQQKNVVIIHFLDIFFLSERLSERSLLRYVLAFKLFSCLEVSTKS